MKNIILFLAFYLFLSVMLPSETTAQAKDKDKGCVRIGYKIKQAGGHRHKHFGRWWKRCHRRCNRHIW